VGRAVDGYNRPVERSEFESFDSQLRTQSRQKTKVRNGHAGHICDALRHHRSLLNEPFEVIQRKWPSEKIPLVGMAAGGR
jgi:hypothetical protein